MKRGGVRFHSKRCKAGAHAIKLGYSGPPQSLDATGSPWPKDDSHMDAMETGWDGHKIGFGD